MRSFVFNIVNVYLMAPTDFSSCIHLFHAVLYDGSNNHGYDVQFDVCRLYGDNTY